MVATHIAFPDVTRRVTVDDPVCHQFSNTAPGGKTLGIHAAGDEKVFYLRCWPQQMQIIGSETLRTVEEQTYTRLLEDGKRTHTLHQIVLNMFEFAGKFVETEIFRNTVHGATECIGFEPTH